MRGPRGKEKQNPLSSEVDHYTIREKDNSYYLFIFLNKAKDTSLSNGINRVDVMT